MGSELQDLVLGVGWGEVGSGLGMSQAGPEKGSFPSVACGKQERRELVFSGPVTEASAAGFSSKLVQACRLPFLRGRGDAEEAVPADSSP